MNKSNIQAIMKDISETEYIYNNINDINSVRIALNINRTECNPILTDDKVINTIRKYYASKLNKLKQDLKKELDKKL